MPGELVGAFPNASAYAVINNTTAVSTELNLSISIYDDAFEEVSWSEIGVIRTNADGGQGADSGWSKYLYRGLRSSWHTITNETAKQYFSFVFGSDDPRAQGAMSGDIVAGILVYGDARDVVIGGVKGDYIKLALGALGIGLTFVGPEADGPYSAVKSGVKLIASVPRVGYDIALTLAKDAGAVVFRRAGDKTTTLVVLGIMAVRTSDVKSLTIAGRAELAEGVHRVEKTLQAEEFVNTLAPTESLGALGHRVRLMAPGGEDAALGKMLRPPPGKGLMPGKSPSEIASRMSWSHDHAMAAALQSTDTARANAPTEVVESFYKLADVDSADDLLLDEWWFAHESQIHPSNPGWYGWVFELHNNARLYKQDIFMRGPDGAVVAPRLVHAEKQLGDEVTAKVDHVVSFGDKKVIVNSKSGRADASGIERREEVYSQMSREARVQKRFYQDAPSANANEIIWLFEKQPTSSMKSVALQVRDETGVKVRFVDRMGVEIEF